MHYRNRIGAVQPLDVVAPEGLHEGVSLFSVSSRLSQRGSSGGGAIHFAIRTSKQLEENGSPAAVRKFTSTGFGAAPVSTPTPVTDGSIPASRSMALPTWLRNGRPKASTRPITMGTSVAARAITEGIRNYLPRPAVYQVRKRIALSQSHQFQFQLEKIMCLFRSRKLLECQYDCASVLFVVALVASDRAHLFGLFSHCESKRGDCAGGAVVKVKGKGDPYIHSHHPTVTSPKGSRIRRI